MRRFLLTAFFVILASPATLAQAGSHSQPVETASSRATGESRARFVLSRVDDPVVREFERAWNNSLHGIRMTEALVLIFRLADGSIKAVSGGYTNEAFKFTFKWRPATFAIIHTHPNSKAPEPQPPDIEIAERFGVPMFTITLSGMYLYDPATRKISKVLDRLDWLKLASWARYSALAAKQQVAKQ